MTNILITGITGLIGKHLMHRLLQEHDYQLVGQYFSPRNTDEYAALGVQMRQADICQESELENLCADCDIVVHSAAKVIDFGSKQEFYLAPYHATRWILDDARRHGVKHFVYISSFGPATYIDRSNGIPDETVPLVKSGVHYDDAKIDAEEYVKHFCSTHNLRYPIVRPAAVVGPDSVWVREPIKRAQTTLGLKLIDGGKWDACLVNAANLADGIFLTISKPQGQNQTFYFMDEYGVSWRQYFTELLAMKGLKPKGKIPRPLALTVARISEKIFPLFGKTPPLSAKSVIATGSDRRVSAQKARTLLGWESHVGYAETMQAIRKSL